MPIFQRGGIETPPPEYRTGPTQTGHTEQREFRTREEVRDYCRANGIATVDLYGHGKQVRACYDPVHDVVAIIDHRELPADEWQEEADHEWAHARGWRHASNGRGTGPNSLRPVGPDIGNALTETSRPPAPNALRP